jgi:hypothetical protein
MPLPRSLGLLPEIWDIIFAKSRRLQRWDARVAHMEGLLRESYAKWNHSYGANPVYPPAIIGQRVLFFASRFKMMELTKLVDEEETNVALYVFDLSTRTYLFVDEVEMEMLFEDLDEDEEEFLQGEEDVP